MLSGDKGNSQSSETKVTARVEAEKRVRVSLEAFWP